MNKAWKGGRHDDSCSKEEEIMTAFKMVALVREEEKMTAV
jgi:hypothetical protein